MAQATRMKKLGLALAGIAALTLAGCSSSDTGVRTGPGPRMTYLGSVAADDPQIVAIARQVLQQGGGAGDAMAAAGLALSVTLPSRAGLGGGGVCLSHQPDNTVVELDFLPQAVAGSAYAVPGMVRGLDALQSHYGRLRWQVVAAPAERLALTGAPASAALIADIAASGHALPGADGAPLKLGNMTPPSSRAAIYSTLRLKGPQDFYAGDIAQRLVAGGMSAEALAAYAPQLVDGAAPLEAGHDRLVFTRNGGGQAATRAWNALINGNAADAATRIALARMAAGASEETPVASTGVVVTDADGVTIGCSFTMGQLWGSGQNVGDTGLAIAAPIDATVDKGMVAAIEYNANNKAVRATLAGAGGTAVGADVAATVWATFFGDMPLQSAISAPRTPAEGQSGHYVPDRVQAAVCLGGLPKKPETCAVASDPRVDGSFAQNVMKDLQ